MKKLDLGLLELNHCSIDEALAVAEILIFKNRNDFFCFCEASLLSNIILSSVVRDKVRKAVAIFPDGIALILLARIMGYKYLNRVPGPSFFLAACEYGVSRGWRHFLYGGAPGVAEKLSSGLNQRFPGIKIVGTHTPPFRQLSEDEELEIKGTIEAANPHLLWVCLGSPKQELWCADHVGRINVPLMLPVGAAFDFHSGKRPWAPAWIRKIGMEWIFRSLAEGRKTLFRNLKCVSIVGFYLVKTAVVRVIRSVIS